MTTATHSPKVERALADIVAAVASTVGGAR